MAGETNDREHHIAGFNRGVDAAMAVVRQQLEIADDASRVTLLHVSHGLSLLYQGDTTENTNARTERAMRQIMQHIRKGL